MEEAQMDNNRSQEEILEVSRKLQDAYKDEEEYWHQKSRNMWHSSGDLNTKFYHALTKQRRVRNKIVGLRDEMGNWITEENRVEKVAADYFDGLFRTTDPTEFDSFFGGNSSFYLSPNESTIIEGRKGERGPTSFIYDAPRESTGAG